MERSKQAAEMFLNGHNCAQSVLISFADDLRYSRELALKIASGFGGGMGKTQGTCGAITGAIMVLGILEGEKASDNEELQPHVYDAVKKLMVDFKAARGTVSCRELTGCDMGTEAGAEKFREEGVKEKICAPCIEEAVRIVERLSGV